MGLTRELAHFVTGHGDEVSARAGREVARAVLDLLGVMRAGAREPAARLMLDHARAGGAGGGATVVGGAGVTLAEPLAALVNGTAGHALDYDDIGLAAGHVSTAIVPAALAVAETRGSSGRELVTALALGYEVTQRLNRVYGDNLAGPYAFGYHKRRCTRCSAPAPPPPGCRGCPPRRQLTLSVSPPPRPVGCGSTSAP